MSKKKNRKDTYQSYLEEFIEFKNNNNKENEYKSISKLYNEINMYYTNRIKNGQLDIKVEKLLLERRIGKYNGQGFNSSISFLLGGALLAIPIMNQALTEAISEMLKGLSMKLNCGFLSELSNFKYGISVFIIVVILCFLVKDIGKDMTEDKNYAVMLNICLKVLEDIEKDLE